MNRTATIMGKIHDNEIFPITPRSESDSIRWLWRCCYWKEAMNGTLSHKNGKVKSVCLSFHWLTLRFDKQLSAHTRFYLSFWQLNLWNDKQITSLTWQNSLCGNICQACYALRVVFRVETWQIPSDGLVCQVILAIWLDRIHSVGIFVKLSALSKQFAGLILDRFVWDLKFVKFLHLTCLVVFAFWFRLVKISLIFKLIQDIFKITCQKSPVDFNNL